MGSTGTASAVPGNWHSSTGTLRPLPGRVDWDSNQNLMIEGGNLKCSNCCKRAYAARLLIHRPAAIQHRKDFVPGQLPDDIKNYLELTAGGGRTERSAVILEASGRFHTDWLNHDVSAIEVSSESLR